MKEQIRDCILSLGADVCGFASVDRFSNAPKGFRPLDIFEECKTVIVFAVALPKGLLHVDSRLIYAHFNEISCPMVDKIAFQTAIMIEKNYDKIAVPLPCDTPYEYWDEESMEGRGLISMKHAAEQAGLGRIGKNSLLINRQYGNMLTIGAVLTDLEITSDPLSESFCIDSCNICINNVLLKL
ncbi:epoxyqueuosine reductase [Lachnoclostridium phytofermentans]|uniref:Iron-sulfur cluster-binding protein n=1 Tax=Lachnoclostridium phytofermentans (strain ATCC 700394 / DSM 18823 / ISDg) TaxID=357809 RepID=A9KR17_LACP7|nr:epoxyqueuosine reductase [Lachnoclostridium phytofermentans]ABX43496.1 iron-sulfur cluster-binding protein [Lachnoclostridium phytofermentans ISDg]